MNDKTNAAPAAAPSSAPSATPAAPTNSSTSSSMPAGTPGASTPADEGLSDLSGLGNTDDFEVVEVPAANADGSTPSAVTPATPAPAGTPATPPVVVAPVALAATPPKEQPAPAPVAPQPAQQPAPAPAPQPAEAAPSSVPSDVNTPQGLAQVLADNHQQLLDATATRFGLSKEEADLFDTDPGQAIPKFGARIYLEAVNGALHHISQFVPRMVEQTIRMQKAVQENEDRFYKQFAGLDRTKHHADVMQFGKAFRATAATQEDLFAMIGAAVMAKHGIAPGTVAAAPAAPALSPQPAAAVPMAPFSPAQGGAHVAITPLDENPFGGLGREHDE